MKKRKGPTPPVKRWAPFQLDVRSPFPDGDIMYGNGWWTVRVKFLEPDQGMDGPLWLSIHDRPRSTRHDWREFQRVKNEVCGPEREAVELYPRESRLIDTANEYHLFVLPVGELVPFGWDIGRLTEVDVTEADTQQAMAEMGVDPTRLYKARQRARHDDKP